MDLKWYLRRARTMSAQELGWRIQQDVIRRRWRSRMREHNTIDSVPRNFDARLKPAALSPTTDITPLVKAADDVLAGSWPVFGKSWDTNSVDWFIDPLTGRTAPDQAYCFDIDHRDEASVGNVKFVWEPSRHHVLTVLATAYYATGDQRYAEKAVKLLDSWMERNPFLVGIHWTSAIEAGVRLVSWTWTRRLLDGWSGVAAAFEGNPQFVRQVHQHQLYLDAFRSRGSSANNHLVVEMSGQFVASVAFPWFAESDQWRATSQGLLEKAVVSQTFADGFNRELATSYHAFVAEFFLLAMLEGQGSGFVFTPGAWMVLRSMFDCAAAMVDQLDQPPRQGDADEAQSLLVDSPEFDRWRSLLNTGATLFGAPQWRPRRESSDIRTDLLAVMGSIPELGETERARRRPTHSRAAGASIFERQLADGSELWCRFDHGPLGYLSIAAHGHSDALSVEVRLDGIDLLADPGTYAYHGDDEWRRYFRSTVGHNTLTLEDRDQAVYGGPFLWLQHPTTSLLSADVYSAIAEHDGFSSCIHRRSVAITPTGMQVTDFVTPGVPRTAIRFHLGPTIECKLVDGVALLTWVSARGERKEAQLVLPGELSWSSHRGETDPPLGWYSARFGEKVPAYTLVGIGATPNPMTSELLVEGARP